MHLTQKSHLFFHFEYSKLIGITVEEVSRVFILMLIHIMISYTSGETNFSDNITADDKTYNQPLIECVISEISLGLGLNFQFS